MKQTIECPRCKGQVGKVFRGQTLEDALERHEHLSHGTGTLPTKSRSKVTPVVATPVVQQETVKILRRRVVK